MDKGSRRQVEQMRDQHIKFLWAILDALSIAGNGVLPTSDVILREALGKHPAIQGEFETIMKRLRAGAKPSK